jgi:hypothetical protein
MMNDPVAIVFDFSLRGRSMFTIGFSFFIFPSGVTRMTVERPAQSNASSLYVTSRSNLSRSDSACPRVRATSFWVLGGCRGASFRLLDFRVASFRRVPGPVVDIRVWRRVPGKRVVMRMIIALDSEPEYEEERVTHRWEYLCNYLRLTSFRWRTRVRAGLR